MKAELSDAELIGVAMLAHVEALSMQAENNMREASGQSPAYQQLYGEASTRLDAELRRRGVL